MTTHLQARAIAAFGRANVPVLLWGPPGAGKSALISALARQLDKPLETVIGSVREPADFNGLPVVDNGTVTMTPPDWFQRLYEAGDGILFADELSTSPPAVQAAMLRLFAERSIESKRLSDDVLMIAAANEAEDAADGWELAPPMANRFAHLTYAFDADTWVTGMTTGWDNVAASDYLGLPPATADRVAEARARVASFITHKPTLLHRQPTSSGASGKAWPSPRTWGYLARTLAYVPDSDKALLLYVATALVGKAAAIEFASWITYEDLPNPGDLLADPSSLVIDKRIDRLYTILQSVVAVAASRGTKSAWHQAWKVCGVAADGKRADVAAAAVRGLLACRPEGELPAPAAMLPFQTILSDAGMLAPTAAAA